MCPGARTLQSSPQGGAVDERDLGVPNLGAVDEAMEVDKVTVDP